MAQSLAEEVANSRGEDRELLVQFHLQQVLDRPQGAGDGAGAGFAGALVTDRQGLVLQQDLQFWEKRMQGSKRGAREVVKTLEHWLRDTDLAGVRVRKNWPSCRSKKEKRGGLSGPR